MIKQSTVEETATPSGKKYIIQQQLIGFNHSSFLDALARSAKMYHLSGSQFHQASGGGDGGPNRPALGGGVPELK